MGIIEEVIGGVGHAAAEVMNVVGKNQERKAEARQEAEELEMFMKDENVSEMGTLKLKCPGCEADLETQDGIDSFYCTYCGTKVIVTGQSKASYYTKLQQKKMEHRERMKDKENAHERYKMEEEKKSQKKSWIIILAGMVVSFLVVGIVMINGYSKDRHQEEKLNRIVEEIMVDIDNNEFDSAYIKANQLYWDSGFSRDGESKWNATRKEVINRIQAAEKKVNNGVSTYVEEEKGFFDSIKGFFTGEN